MFVDFHEIAERDRKDGLINRRERIDAQQVFQTREQNGEADFVPQNDWLVGSAFSSKA
jgi:hypothetical protein